MIARLTLTLALLLASPATATPDYAARVAHVLATTPLIDGHNDWPEQLRKTYGEKWWAADLTADGRALPHPLQTDIPRLRAGHVGGQFWSVWVPVETTGPAAVSPHAIRRRSRLRPPPPTSAASTLLGGSRR
jgi:membrane dipeptidase